MRVVLTIPDDVVTVEVYVKSKNEAITYSRIFEGGSITNSRFIDKEETMGMRYTEGLEKRIDAIEAELREEIPRRFGVAHETFVKLDKRIEELEKRLAKLGKPCVDMETIVGAIGAPKLKPIPEPLENRGPYADILRRLGALEKRANVARADITKIMGHKVTLEERVDKLEGRPKTSRPTWEYFNKLLERIEGLEGRVEPIESLLDKGEDGAYPFVPTVKDYAEIKQKIDALEKDAKTSRPTWDNFSLHDQRICKLESRMEDAEKKAAVAESVRKQLAADIKATNGRIQDLEERTGSRDRLYAY